MIEQINHVAEIWWQWTAAMFWQAGLLILLIALIDRLIRKWAWPQVRYGLWSLILIKLILPPTLSLPTGVAPKLSPLVTRVLETGNQSPEIPIEETATPSFPYLETDVRQFAPQSGPYFSTIGGNVPAAEDSVGDDSMVRTAGPQLGRCAYMMIIWLLGTVTLGSWLLAKLGKLVKEHADKSPQGSLPESFHARLDQCARHLKLRRVPAVVVTKEVRTPAVFGMFRPALLMPTGYIRRLSRKDTEHLLLHELAHIKRGDLVTHGIYMLLQLVYWYNPLLWLVRRRLRHLRELCCDATVAGLLKHRTVEYRRTLLEAARQFLSTPVEYGLGLVGLFEDSNCLISRINRLEKPIWRHQTMKKLITITTILILFACVLPMAKAKQESASNDATVSSDSSENNSVKAQEEPADSAAHSHEATADAQHWEHWAQQMEHWAGQMEHWAEHQKSWADSDDFKQWQKDMNKWAKEMQQAKMSMRQGADGPAAVLPMPAMPPMPPMSTGMAMPSVPVMPVVPVVHIPHVAAHGEIPAMPTEKELESIPVGEVEIKKDKDGKYVATTLMKFVSKVKPDIPFVIRNNVGRIVLRPSKDDQCNVRAVIRGKAGTGDEAKAKVERVAVDNESTEERYHFKPIIRDGGKWNDLSVDLYITVPTGVLPDVQTDMGSVELYDLKGKIKAVTKMGAVKSVNTTGDLELLTKMGSIEFVAPKDLSAKLSAQTKMGSINSDLPLDINRADMFRRSAQGTVGDGQGDIRMTTDMGSIILKWYSSAQDSPIY